MLSHAKAAIYESKNLQRKIDAVSPNRGDYSVRRRTLGVVCTPKATA
jgi:hypothetical protein